MNEFQTNSSRSARLPHKRLFGALRLLTIFSISLALLMGLSQGEHTLDMWEVVFITLTTSTLLVELYWLLGPYIETKKWRSDQLSDQQLELFTPTNVLYSWRHNIRMGLHPLLVIASQVLSMHVASIASTTSTSDSVNAMLALGFFIFSLIFLEWFTAESIQHYGLGPLWGLWLVISLVIGLDFGYSFYLIKHDNALTVIAGMFGIGIALMIYFAKRLEVGQQVWSEVIGELISHVLKTPYSKHDLDLIVREIANRLGYEHVSLLKVQDDNNSLQIVAEYGTSAYVTGCQFSVNEGIDGRAYRSGKTCAWNDVRLCPYYKRILAQERDQTQAEIAVPIIHQGQTFGILDVQSHTSLVFGPGDIRTLEVIAQILGAAWAARKMDSLIEQGTKLWDQLSGEIHSENDVFQIFAEFAQQNLGADLVVYYRLSPTGYPTHAPQVVGNLFGSERMNSPVFDRNSPMFELIRRWKPYHEEQVQSGGLFLHELLLDKPSFATRENIQSSFFIPIGMQDERMAVVFLNYRRKQIFDGLFQLMVLGFAQGFATTLAREWYRDLIFHGLARPELGVHNILGRYGMKDGVMQEGREILRNQQNENLDIEKRNILELLQNVDNCLIEIRAQTAKVSINWESTLRERVDDMTRKIKEHVPASRTVRFIKSIDPLVERESPWTRLALYRVIEEAVNNGIFHGEASEITISVERAENAVLLSVQNNGIPLPQDAAEKHSRSGIFEILDEIKDRFRAQVQITPLEKGTIVKVQMPALPNNQKERQR